MKEERQTLGSFSEKWSNNPDLAWKATLDETSEIFQWVLNRNGFSSSQELLNFLEEKKKILDAGCGNGRILALLHQYAPMTTEFVGIDLTSANAAQSNLCNLSRITILPRDIFSDLSELGKFDFIYCQEVLHHTPNPREGFLNLCSSLSKNGEIAIYVYKIKAPLREYADDYIRSIISDLTYEEASRLMLEVAHFGAALSNLSLKVRVPQVQLLEIEAGEYDIQRLIYHFFFKCFWNKSLSLEENVAINYDWYHPQLATRHTFEEVQDWFLEAGLEIVHEHIDYYGITIRGKNKREF